MAHPNRRMAPTGSRGNTMSSYPMAFMGQPMQQIAGVQFAEVEIDTWTGVVKAKRVLNAAYDGPLHVGQTSPSDVATVLWVPRRPRGLVPHRDNASVRAPICHSHRYSGGRERASSDSDEARAAGRSGPML